MTTLAETLGTVLFDNNIIPVLSLAVAALAVFVGPLISLRIARRQVMSSLEVANKQIVAPMRQAWINSLRDLLAEVTSSAHHYFLAGFEGRKEEEHQRLYFLEGKIRLMLNPKEEDHRKLEVFIRNMIGAIEGGKKSLPKEKAGNDFITFYREVIKLSREVLKREWDRVKEPIVVALTRAGNPR